MSFYGKKLLLLGAAIPMFVISPIFASGGGGGGGGGGGELPSQSAPAYDPAVEYQKGTEAFKAQKYKDAITAFKRVVLVAPKNAPAQYLLGASYMAVSDFKKAQKPLENAVKNDANLIEAHRDLGVTLAKLGQADKASARLNAIKAMKAACSSTCSDGARLDDAIAKVEKAISGGKVANAAVAPDIKLAAAKSADDSYVAAVSLINEKRYDEAIAVLDSALWSAGPHPDMLTYLGFAHRKLHQYDAAKTYYEEALAIAPNHLGALEYYGELKLELGNVAGAKSHLARLDQLCGFGCHEADELRGWINGTIKSVS